ncbi:hypothetical protein AX15_003181 [Amanita polypyramis BW_CC]|nr:hypothetical protein AX15_003181 [Amanita polypyramis BW_CC]
MSFVKSKLRLARDALDKKDYTKAKEAALEVLDYDTNNYNAHVFLGLALLEMGELNESEQTYRKAIEFNPDQQLAWQGLSKLYERAGRWQDYVESLYQLLNTQYSQNDAVKCAETLQKLISACREGCGRSELIDALGCLLPDSRFYTLLSTLPAPDNSSPLATTVVTIQSAIYESLPTFQEIASLMEANEEDLVRKEIQKRRTRLGAPSLEQLQKQVGEEIWGSSRLPVIYAEITNHPQASDHLRREAESKLLRYKYRYLCVLPDGDAFVKTKERTLHEVNELVDSAVLLHIPDELAWNLSLENQDSESIATCNQQLLQDFVKLFPNTPLAILLDNFFSYVGFNDHQNNNITKLEMEDTFSIFLDAYSEVSNNIIANRALAEIYLKEEDYENALRIADQTLFLLKKREREIGRGLSRSSTGIKVIKVTSLVHFCPPKHHVRASVIIDDVLSQDPGNVSCLLGRAFILQASYKWEESGTLFLRIVDMLPEDAHDRLRCMEEAAWCQFQYGQYEEGLASLQRSLTLMNAFPNRGLDRARCLWRIGKCHWAMDGDDRQEPYRCYVESLKQDPTYAPAFTSLGIYYSEIVPPDPIRASKCFQKAFELDPREAEAARRLAGGFAEDQEWDLLEVVARRVIEGEGGLTSDLRLETSDVGELKPKNHWAWKAIGIVELNRGKYVDAIKAFQTTLIMNMDDVSAWIRLGEAYSKSGRHTAALKAFIKAKELDPDDWSCSYFIAEVKRLTGEFQEAIAIYTELLCKRPDELVIQVSLMQTYFEVGRLEQLEGFQERAEHSFLMAIQLILGTVQKIPDSRVAGWKTLADTLFFLSGQSNYTNGLAIRRILMEIVHEFRLEVDDDLMGVIPRPDMTEEAPLSWKQVLATALTVYYYRLTMSSSGTLSGSQWHDFGVGLQTWVFKTGIEPASAVTKAVFCLRRALQENTQNASYWAALGTLHFLNHAKLAQHAYITALEIDVKSVVNWNNLGLLYLHHGDLELANESFIRAQTLDPENSVSWIGQALLRSMSGLDSETHELLAHAVTLNSIKPEVDLRFAQSTFHKHLTSLEPLTTLHELLPAFFSLHRYCLNRRDDAFAHHLLGLVNESLEKLVPAVELIEKSTSLLEVEYEDTEDPTVERQFALANLNLARLRLTQQDLTGAINSFQSVIGLLTGDDDTLTIKLRIQTYIGYGLAKFMNMEVDSALELFQTALVHAEDIPVLRSHAIVLLSQVMWATGNDEFRELAKSQLLQCIASDSKNLTAIKTLAGMGILSNDENLIDAALSELLDMPAEQRQGLDPSDDVNYLLIHYNLSKGDFTRASMFAQRALHAMPSSNKFRSRLAIMMFQHKAMHGALALLLGDEDVVPQDPQVLSERLCLLAIMYASNDSAIDMRLAVRFAQKAITTLPCSIRPWQTLAFVQSRAALRQ